MVIEELVVLEAVLAGPGAVCGSNLAPGACGRFSRPGISNSRLIKICFRGPCAAASVMISEVRRSIPRSPTTGFPISRAELKFLLASWACPPTANKTPSATAERAKRTLVIQLGRGTEFGERQLVRCRQGVFGRAPSPCF